MKQQEWPDLDSLQRLDKQMRRAFDSGDESELDVLGYGEISAVVRIQSSAGSFACKRLPPFPDRRRLLDYRECFETYVQALGSTGLRPISSTLIEVEGLVLFCVQPMLDARSLAVSRFAQADRDDRIQLFERIRDQVMRTIKPELGLDAQLSNWVVAANGELQYLDLTTPLLRDSDDNERLDTDLFVASLPWVIRGAVRRFALKDILKTYYEPRRALRDLLANLYKERLTESLPALIAVANEVLETPIQAEEVRRYYQSDARTWTWLLRMRRIDRSWQRHMRRRPYPVLLPGPIAR